MEQYIKEKTLGFSKKPKSYCQKTGQFCMLSQFKTFTKDMQSNNPCRTEPKPKGKLKLNSKLSKQCKTKITHSKTKKNQIKANCKLYISEVSKSNLK